MLCLSGAWSAFAEDMEQLILGNEFNGSSELIWCVVAEIAWVRPHQGPVPIGGPSKLLILRHFMRTGALANGTAYYQLNEAITVCRSYEKNYSSSFET